MFIKILTENLAGGKFMAEHGLAYLVEIDNKKILFDTGYSDLFLKNAHQLKVDIQKEVETIVLSHGHWDHGNGLKYVSGKTLITHPDSFTKRFRKSDSSPVGLSISKDEIQDNFELKTTKVPVQLSKHLYFLGEIPRVTDFESQTTPFMFANGEDDFILDDSALVAIVNKELVIITGCSHSGICNISENAKRITGISKIKAVIGGFHLKHKNKQTTETVNYFKKNKVEKLYPSHCTDLPALSLFHEEFDSKRVKTGMTFEF